MASCLNGSARVCCEPEGLVSKEVLSYVGDGNGCYEQVEGYDYVGDGVGSFEEVTVTKYYPWWMRVCCVVCGLIVVLIGVIFVAGYQPDATATMTPVPTPAAADVAAAPVAAPAPASASPDRPFLRYDCKPAPLTYADLGLPVPAGVHKDVAIASSSEAWSNAKRKWCCSNRGMGCTTPSAPSSAATPSKQGALVPRAQLGCETDCIFVNYTATCTKRINWAANIVYKGGANPCAAAHALVLKDCPYCSGCHLEDLQCEVTTPPPTVASPPAPVATALPPANVPPAPQAQQPALDIYNCFSGPGRWSEFKKHYCCDHHQIGCDHHSEPHPSNSVGLPPAPFVYNCDAGAATWQQGWSTEKQAWCCEHFSKGCSTGGLDVPAG